MVSPGDIHDYRLTAAEPAHGWSGRHGRAVGGGGQLLPAPPLTGAAAADAGGDPGLEPGQGRRHRHAPCDLLSSRGPGDQSAPDRSIATGRPCRTEAAAAAPSLQRGEVPCDVEPAKIAAGSVLRGPPRSPPAGAADRWAVWERHTTRSLPSGSHSRTWPGQGQGSTSSSGKRRPQLGHHAVPALALRRWPRSSGQTGTTAHIAAPGRPSPSRPPARPVHHPVTMQRPAPSRRPRGSSTIDPKEPAPPTGQGGSSQEATGGHIGGVR
jgi:hypothetical protein